jgi:hypothetical protein
MKNDSLAQIHPPPACRMSDMDSEQIKFSSSFEPALMRRRSKIIMVSKDYYISMSQQAHLKPVWARVSSIKFL